MSRTAVVAFPTFGQTDTQWIESIRARHDPLAKYIGAHVTLVFPSDVVAGLAEEVVAVATSTEPISFPIQEARAVRDAFADGGHVFLVPSDHAASDIAKLHNRLYEGILKPALREDIPYVPHITVASSKDFADCVRVAEDIARTMPTIVGLIEHIDVVALTETRALSTQRLTLGRASV